MKDSFFAGLVIGIFVGILVAPLLRSYLEWRQWRQASRWASLADEVLDRMAGRDEPGLSTWEPDGPETTRSRTSDRRDL